VVNVWTILIADPEGVVFRDYEALCVDADAAVSRTWLSEAVALIRGRRKYGKARI
jgi:hypothetical protein